MKSKKMLRHGLVGLSLAQHEWGRAAEQLRRTEVYRRAGEVFVGPADILQQIRINVLMDGKTLVMPSPALKDGFYLCKPQTVPFGKRSFAVTFSGLAKFGQRLRNNDLSRLDIGLFVTDCLAWDNLGNRLGSGNGFFDLAWALLHAMKAVSSQSSVFGVAGQGQYLGSLPVDSWDVKLDGLISEKGVESFSHESKEGLIFWDQLSAKRIKKISPLWSLSRNITP